MACGFKKKWNPVFYTPHFSEVERGVYWFHLVCLSVCGQNCVRSVSSTILVGSNTYMHILSSISVSVDIIKTSPENITKYSWVALWCGPIQFNFVHITAVAYFWAYSQWSPHISGPISRPYGWAMGCLLWVFWKKKWPRYKLDCTCQLQTYIQVIYIQSCIFNIKQLNAYNLKEVWIKHKNSPFLSVLIDYKPH